MLLWIKTHSRHRGPGSLNFSGLRFPICKMAAAGPSWEPERVTCVTPSASSTVRIVPAPEGSTALCRSPSRSRSRSPGLVEFAECPLLHLSLGSPRRPPVGFRPPAPRASLCRRHRDHTPGLPTRTSQRGMARSGAFQSRILIEQPENTAPGGARLRNQQFAGLPSCGARRSLCWLLTSVAV